MKKRTKIKQSLEDRIFDAVNGALLTLMFVLILYPILYVISASFSDPMAVSSGRMVLLPVNPSLDAYRYILQYREIWTGYVNTIIYTVTGTVINLIFTLPCAYALSRKDMPDRGVLMGLFVFTMYFGGGLIPTYLNMYNLGLINTRWSILLGGVISTYNLIVARTFFGSTIPWELHEAAFLDGCGDYKAFIKIIIPLSAPIVAVLALYYGVGYWNSYFDAMIYIQDRSLLPLQVFLREILMLSQYQQEAMEAGGYTVEQLIEMAKQADTANMIKYAIIIVSVLPMMILYPFLQKFFAKGVMIGAVKG